MAPSTAADGPLRTRLKARQLALLVALAEHGSLRRAAAEVAVSQPAATKLLHDLEDTLGVSLFDRHSWGMEPTIFGETMIRCARGVLTDLAEARDELAALASGAGGKLRVGAVTGAVPRLLVPALNAVRARAPGLKTYVLVNANEVLAAGLRQGTLDLAIGALPPHEEVGTLAAEPLADEPLCVVGGPAHGLRLGSQVAARRPRDRHLDSASRRQSIARHGRGVLRRRGQAAPGGHHRNRIDRRHAGAAAAAAHGVGAAGRSRATLRGARNAASRSTPHCLPEAAATRC